MTTQIPYDMLASGSLAALADINAGTAKKLVSADALKEKFDSMPAIISGGPRYLSSFQDGSGIGNEAADSLALTNALASGEDTIVIDSKTFYLAADRYDLLSGTTLTGNKRSVLKLQDTTHSDGVLNLDPGVSDIELVGFSMQGPWAGVGGQYAAGMAAVETLGSAASPNRNLSFRDLFIDGFGDNGIRLIYAQYSRVDRCDIRNIGRTGVQVLSGYDLDINNNQIRNIAPGAGGAAPNLNAYGIALTLSNADAVPTRLARVIGNFIDGVPSWEGIDTHAGDDILIANNVVINTYLGIVLMASGSGATYTDAATRISVLGNVVERRSNSIVPNTRAGILVVPWSSVNAGAKARDIIVSGNRVRNMGRTDGVNAEGGIMAENVLGLLIEGNNVADCFGRGIETGLDVYGAVMNNLVTGIATAAGVAQYYAFMNSACGINADGNTAYRRSGSGTAFNTSPAGAGLTWGASNVAIGF